MCWRPDISEPPTKCFSRPRAVSGGRGGRVLPLTALPVDQWIDNSLTGDAGSRLAEIELHAADVDKFRQLAASGRRAASMSEATGGDPDPRRRRRELLHPRGFGDELRTVCLGESGMWGAIVMHRERGAANFTTRDVDLLASLAGQFEEVRRMRLERDLSADAGDRDRGLLVLDDEDGIEVADAAAAAWLDELHDRRPRRTGERGRSNNPNSWDGHAQGLRETLREHQSGSVRRV